MKIRLESTLLAVLTAMLGISADKCDSEAEANSADWAILKMTVT